MFSPGASDWHSNPRSLLIYRTLYFLCHEIIEWLGLERSCSSNALLQAGLPPTRSGSPVPNVLIDLGYLLELCDILRGKKIFWIVSNELTPQISREYHAMLDWRGLSFLRFTKWLFFFFSSDCDLWRRTHKGINMAFKGEDHLDSLPLPVQR